MSEAPKKCNAFTIEYPGIMRQLRSPAKISSGDRIVDARGLWDTGASCTCISYSMADQLGLIPTGNQIIQTPSGKKTCNTYVVNLHLPNNVKINDVPVCDSDIGDQGVDVLIGMDIISFGDFAVSNYDRKTVVTFRMPSQKVTDFYKQQIMENAIGQRHGKGLKKKKR